MKKLISILFLCMGFAATVAPTHASFIISSAVVEFRTDGSSQQDIEIISQTNDTQYLSAEIRQVIGANTLQEESTTLENPAESGLIVTPNKMILPGSARKILRFVLLEPPSDKERIYRVAIKPEVRGLKTEAVAGLKILVGYEVLVIVRAAEPEVDFLGKKTGHTLTIINKGNTSLLFQQGKQCNAPEICKNLPGERIYPGETRDIRLPSTEPVSYDIWDGTITRTQRFE